MGAWAHFSTALGKGQDKLALVSAGKSDFAIVIPDQPGETERYAAQELQTFLEKISGVRLDVLAEKDAGNRKAVLIGATLRGSSIIPDGDLQPLGQEGFVLRTQKGDLAIRGGGPRGVLYGVYSLLEDHLGVRWYAPGADLIPKMETIDLPALDVSDKPAFEYREPFFFEQFDGDWAARNRANGNSDRLEEKHGGKIQYFGGFVHTANSLLPPSQYFAGHPEYFAEIAGRRVQDGQPCWTNPDVRKIIVQRVMELAESTAGKPSIISVSQNDNSRRCECARCMAVEREEGSPSGPLLRLVNEVADAVAVKYPNVAIDTLAYSYTEDAPRITRPRPNVIIRLCHMAPSCDLHPLGKCPLNEHYVGNLKAWNKISNRLYVWHYVTNFHHYPLPFPNLNAIVKDMKFYNKNSVKGLFAQGSYQSPGGDMAELKAWLIAKLLWNPYRDPEPLVDDFIKGYYGPAAPAMAEYIAVQRRRVKSPNLHAHLFSDPRIGYLNEETLEKMGAALDRAEALAASDTAYSDRVARARMWYLYVWAVAPDLFYPKGHVLKPNERKKAKENFQKFKTLVQHFGVTYMSESEGTDVTMRRLRLVQYGGYTY
jgi:hypothetical protein